MIELEISEKDIKDMRKGWKKVFIEGKTEIQLEIKKK